uniref:Uncharacterized protein n=3 Tax=Parascaris univalens TaxID=6257 RepID=A0A915A1P4_PARUN
MLCCCEMCFFEFATNSEALRLDIHYRMYASRKRCSNGPDTILPSSRKRRSSVSNGESADIEDSITTEALALKLDNLRENLVKKKIGSVDLAGFDVKRTCKMMEFLRSRQQVKRMMGNPRAFDENVGLNYNIAAVGGAKLLIDQTRTTRSISEKLVSCCRLNENEFLYDGLYGEHSEAKTIEQIKRNRQSSVLESFVDFQKQIQFKMSVLNHMAKKVAGRSSRSNTPAAGKKIKKGSQSKTPSRKGCIKGNQSKTPSRKGYINPLDSRRILDSYAMEVASQVTNRLKKRRVVGIPFNIHLLDDEEE